MWRAVRVARLAIGTIITHVLMNSSCDSERARLASLATPPSATMVLRVPSSPPAAPSLAAAEE